MNRSHAVGARHSVDALKAGVQRADQQAHRAAGASKDLAAPLSNQAVAQALGSGTPLAPEVRAEMETRFGVDLGGVRIHDRQPDQQLAHQLSAQAFALGEHIAFNQGRYAPGTQHGKHLLAHELAHVIQQRRRGPTAPQFEGGPLEASAECAACDVVGGSGPVNVAGASAVGVARQPLPEQPASDLPPPRSLAGSLLKSEKALSDDALHQEIGLIQQWLDRHPASPGSDHLAIELDQLLAEDLSRTGQRVAEEARKPKAEEGSATGMARMIREAHLEADEIAAAHRSYRATGLIPRTVSPIAPVEAKVGRPMSRSERYDVMLKLQHQNERVTVSDLTFDELYPGEGRRDPEFLTHEEFKKEFYDRYRKEEKGCTPGLITRPDVRDRCLHDLEGEWGGEAYRAAREESYQRAYALWLHAQQQIESMQSGGLGSLVGRVGGYALGYATHHDPLQWSEYGAALGGMGDVGFGLYGGMNERARLQSYSEGGGLEVGRDADIGLMLPRSSPSAITPPELTPTTPGGAATLPEFPQSIPAGSIGGPGPGGASDATLGGLLAAPIPISTGKGLPQSQASKALEANLANQSSAQVGTVTPLPVRKPETPSTVEAAQEKMPAVAAEGEKIAVGQTHGPGAAAQSAARPQLSAIQSGNQSAAASASKSATKPAKSGSISPASSPKTAAKARATKPASSEASSKQATPGSKAQASKAAGKGTPKLPPLNAAGGRGSNAERLVAVRMQGGGAARKGTYFIEGTPEFEAAAKDNRFSVMPESQAIVNKFRPAGTPFDPKIEPVKVGGVQVESNAAGTGKGNKHNISARADIQSTEKARQETFGKTVGASVAEAHGHKTLVSKGELSVLRPGNASTGGVDSITADVGRTPSTGPGGAEHDPAGTPAATPASQGPATRAKVFLNDFTGPKTSKGAKSTHVNWVRELGDAVTHRLFGFGNKRFDDAVHDATLKGEVYVRTVRIQSTSQGIKVTPETPRKVTVPAAVKKAVIKFREDKSK